MEAHAAASAKEAAALRVELSAKAAALRERNAAEEMLAERLRASEGRLRASEGQHRELQEVHGALKVAHAEQGTSLRRQLALARQRLSDAAAAQEAAAADAAEARQRSEQLSAAVAEQGALREQLRGAQHEAATYKGRYLAVQHANDSLRLQIMAAPTAGPAAARTQKPVPAMAHLPPSPTAGRPAIALGCRITAAAAATPVARMAAVGLPGGAATARPHTSAASLALQRSSPTRVGAAAMAAGGGSASPDWSPASPSATSVCISVHHCEPHDREHE